MSKSSSSAKFEVAIVGLGYVGVPLALGFAEAGCRTLGFDINSERDLELQRGKSPFKHIASERIAKAIDDGMLEFTTNRSLLSQSEAIIVCVPTPLRSHQDPNLSHILEVAEGIGPYLRDGMLVSLESTTYPGTTRGEFRAMLERHSGLKAGTDFHLCFSPEREDPGNAMSKLREVPKVVGGFTAGCMEKAVSLYEKAVDTVVPVHNCDTAEAVKLTENIFRFTNIALVNELKEIYAQLDVDIWEVIEAAKTKPFGFMPFYPGPGVGGHCIPVDPYYLTWKAREFGIDCRFIELAGQVNRSMPGYVANHLLEAMNDRGQLLHGSSVLVVGVAYKSDVSDDRESPSYHVMDILQQKGAKVDYYDPHVLTIGPDRGQWAGCHSICWDLDVLQHYAAAVVCTAHAAVNYEELADTVPLIVDACNVVPKNRHARVVSA
ncbi:nucleotide sugar dehydrogenase [Rubritalea tangerina]|uniref:Nucleotide sugar dehydrogenase n=1 Tax=Rubritalea tangerina TaxID=430798 RepID=A0ABW4ZFB4_9BACT